MAGVRWVFNDIPKLPSRAETGATRGLATVGARVQTLARTYAPRRTGRLEESLFFELVSSLSLRFGDTAPYAAYVEYGTSKMRAQPYLGRAIAVMHPEFVTILRDAIGPALRAA